MLDVPGPAPHNLEAERATLGAVRWSAAEMDAWLAAQPRAGGGSDSPHAP